MHATDPTCNFKKEGTFVNGEIRKGTYYHSNGDRYHGYFDANGQASGKGALLQEHATYNGEWKNNKRHGKFEYMRRVCTPGSSETFYIHCIGAFENNKRVTFQTDGNKKRKADFDAFTGNCKTLCA